MAVRVTLGNSNRRRRYGRRRKGSMIGGVITLWCLMFQCIIILGVASLICIISAVSLFFAKSTRPANIALVNNATEIWEDSQKQIFLEKFNNNSIFISYMDASLPQQKSEELTFSNENTYDINELKAADDVVPLEEWNSCHYSTSISLDTSENSLSSEIRLGIKINTSSTNEDSLFSGGVDRFRKKSISHGSGDDKYYTYEYCKLKTVIIGVPKDNIIDSKILEVKGIEYSKICDSMSKSEYTFGRLDNPVSSLVVTVKVKSENDPEMVIADLLSSSSSLGATQGFINSSATWVLVGGIVLALLTCCCVLCYPFCIACTCYSTIKYYKRLGSNVVHSSTSSNVAMAVAFSGNSNTEMKGQVGQPNFQPVPQQQYQQVPQQNMQNIHSNQQNFQQLPQQLQQPVQGNQFQQFQPQQQFNNQTLKNQPF